MLKNDKYSDKLPLFAAIITAIAAFIVYTNTLAPTVWFIDSGELAAVASTLGIAHPTGYPLFTILGYLFTKLPIGSSEIYRLNLMSAFFCTLGIFVFFFLIKYLINYSVNENLKTSKIKDTKQKKDINNKNVLSELTSITDAVIIIISVSSSLILAFSKTYWSASNSVEVYPLHTFFIITLMLVFIKAINQKNELAAGKTFFQENKYYIIFAFLLGLSFTNHLTTILLAPACLTLFLYTNFKNKNIFKLLAIMTFFFIAGLSVYLYLPIRANMNPTFIWGNPYNLERLYWHVTGKQFSVWIFSAQGSLFSFILLISGTIALSVYGLVKQKILNSNMHFIFFIIICLIGFFVISGSAQIVSDQFKKFSNSIWSEFGYGIIILSLAGIYLLSKLNIRLFYFTLLCFLGCIFYSVNYDIHDIYSYFLLAYITLAVWAGFGILFILLFLKKLTNIQLKPVYAAIILIFPLISLYSNYAENDESHNFYVEEYTMNIFTNAEPNSIIISSQWDFWVSASWYFQFVKNIRRDLVVIDKELLRRSWYFKYLQNNYPEIYNNSKQEIEKFLPELYKFEHNIPYDRVLIVKLFEELITSFVKNNPERKSYITWEIEQNKNERFAQEYIRIPDGLLFRLVPKSQFDNKLLSDYKIYDFKFTPVKPRNYYYETLMNSYAMMLTNSASYLLSYNSKENAMKYLELSLIAVPNYNPALEIKRKFNIH